MNNVILDILGDCLQYTVIFLGIQAELVNGMQLAIFPTNMIEHIAIQAELVNGMQFTIFLTKMLAYIMMYGLRNWSVFLFIGVDISLNAYN